MASINRMNPEFSLPLANAKNRQLQNQVREKRDRLAKLVQGLEQNESKIRSMEQELVALEQSCCQTSNLSGNLRSQAQKEREALKLAENEASALEREKKRLNETMQQTIENNQRQQKRLEDFNKDMTKMQQMLDDDAKIVQVMEEMVESQQEDQTMLETFAKQDELKIKELEVKLAKVREEAMEARRRYVEAREERQSTAIQLQNMQEEFRKMMEDRNQSLQRWESTLNQMEICKVQMDQCDKEYRNALSLNSAENSRLEQKNKSNQMLQEEIASLERTLQSREYLGAQLNLKYTELEKLKNEKEMEFQAIEAESKRLTEETDERNAFIAKQKEKLAKLDDKISEEKKHIEELEKKLQQFQGAVTTAEAHRASLEIALKAEEERVVRQRHQAEQLDNECVRIEADIRQAKSLMESYASEMRACGAGIRNLENRVKETKKQVQHHEELLYHKNLEILRADLELKGLRGAVNDPELRQKQRQEAELLKTELEQNQSHMVALKHELLKTNSDVIGLQRSCDQQQQRKAIWSQQLHQLQMECQQRERESKDLRREVEEIRMEESLINLEIRRRENTLQIQSSAVENLENQRKHIEGVIRERWEELNHQMENLQVEVRSLRERTQQLAVSVKQKSAEVERIKLRHELIACTLAGETGEDQEPTEAYFIIKMAQDKEMLKESIKEIEGLVSKLESDNVALYNTLKLVMSSNQQFRQHTIVGVLTDDDKALKIKMEQENQQLEQAIHDLRKDIKQLHVEVKELEDEVKHLKGEAKNVKYMLEDKEFLHKQASEEIELLRKKIERATGLCQQLQKQLRRAKKTKHKTDEEVDFEISQMRDWCATVLSLAKKEITDDEARIALDKYLDETPDGRQLKTNIVQIIRPRMPKMRLNITDFPRASAASHKSTARSDKSGASSRSQLSSKTAVPHNSSQRSKASSGLEAPKKAN